MFIATLPYIGGYAQAASHLEKTLERERRGTHAMTQSDESGEDEYLTVKDVQRITKFGSVVIYRALQSGELVASKRPGLRGHYRITRGAVNDWVKGTQREREDTSNRHAAS